MSGQNRTVSNRHPPSKNRVWDFFATFTTSVWNFVTQPVEPHRETPPPSTFSASGVLFYGFRYYSPTLGRWVGRDPLNKKRASRNLYLFVSNRPLIRIDVLGKDEHIPSLSYPLSALNGSPIGPPENAKDGVPYVMYDMIIGEGAWHISVMGATGESPDSDGMAGVSGGGDEAEMLTYYGRTSEHTWREMLDNTPDGAPCVYMNKCTQKCGCGSLTWPVSWAQGALHGFVSSIRVESSGGEEEGGGGHGTIWRCAKCIVSREEMARGQRRCARHVGSVCSAHD